MEFSEEMTEETRPTKENVTNKKTGKAMTEFDEQSTETARKEMTDEEVSLEDEIEIETDTVPDTIEIDVEAANDTTTTTTKTREASKLVLPNNNVLSSSRDKRTENGETPLDTKISRKKITTTTYPIMQKTPRTPTLPQAPINNRTTTKNTPSKKIKVYKRLVPKRTYGSDKEPLKDLLSEMPSLRKTTKSKPQKRVKNTESGELWFSKPKQSHSSLSTTIQKLSNT